MISWVIALSLAATSTAADARLQAELRLVVGGARELPALDVVQRASVEALALMGADSQDSWPSRARLANLLPTLDASMGSDVDVDVRDSVSRTVSRTTTEGQGFVFRVGARWRLSGFVFETAELRASRELLARSIAVAKAKERATRLYFERVRVWAKLRERPTPALRLRAAELDGLLRAATGGVYRTKRKGT